MISYMIRIRLSFAFLLLCVVTVGTYPAAMRAQVAPTAFRSPISLTVGGTASLFNPQYITDNIGGLGAYVDLSEVPRGLKRPPLC